jgi:hypothetical protein
VPRLGQLLQVGERVGLAGDPRRRSPPIAAARLAGVSRTPTAPVAAASFLLSWAAVEASGSRTVGGIVLSAGGIWCLSMWTRRHGWRTAARLGAIGLLAFALSHVLGLLLGAWPAVAIAAAAMAAIAWTQADRREPVRAVAAA